MGHLLALAGIDPDEGYGDDGEVAPKEVVRVAALPEDTPLMWLLTPRHDDVPVVRQPNAAFARRQEALAAARGEAHVGAVMQKHGDEF